VQTDYRQSRYVLKISIFGPYHNEAVLFTKVVFLKKILTKKFSGSLKFKKARMVLENFPRLRVQFEDKKIVALALVLSSNVTGLGVGFNFENASLGTTPLTMV